MAAFFVSIATLFALLVLATAACVALRFRAVPPLAPSAVVGEEFPPTRRHFLGGTLAVGLMLLFSATLLFAVIVR